MSEVERVEGPNLFDDVDVTPVVGADLVAAYRSGEETAVPPAASPGGDPPG